MKLSDFFGVRDDPFQIRLIKKGKPAAGLYKDASGEKTSKLPRKDDEKARPSDR